MGDVGAQNRHRADEERAIRDWRQEQSKLMQNVEADRRREQREIDIQDSRKFQEAKRLTRELAQEEDARFANSLYIESKENAQYNADRKRIEPMVEEKVRVEDNLEKYRTFAEYQFMEKEQLKEEERTSQHAQQQSEAEAVIKGEKRKGT